MNWIKFPFKIFFTPYLVILGFPHNHYTNFKSMWPKYVFFCPANNPACFLCIFFIYYLYLKYILIKSIAICNLCKLNREVLLYTKMSNSTKVSNDLISLSMSTSYLHVGLHEKAVKFSGFIGWIRQSSQIWQNLKHATGTVESGVVIYSYCSAVCEKVRSWVKSWSLKTSAFLTSSESPEA